MYQIKPEDSRLLAEYRDVPSRHHSLELRRLLNRLRIEPTAGKVVIEALGAGQGWRLIRLSGGRGDRPAPVDGRVFTDLAEARWALLKIRWETHTGWPFPADLA